MTRIVFVSFCLLTILQVALAELQGGGQATTPATTAAEVSLLFVCEEHEKMLSLPYIQAIDCTVCGYTEL